jgi:two-component system CheB/CheR fusion protein
MKNLLNSTDIATLFLDAELRVRRFTTATARIIKLIPGDVGRPITDLVSDLDYPDLAGDAREVLRLLMFRERQAGTRDGRYFVIRIMPYRTQDNVIDGVVITFSDASPLRALEIALAEQTSQLRQLADALPLLVWTARPDGALDYLGHQWVEYTGMSEAAQLGWSWLEQVHPQDLERIRDSWRATIKAGTPFSADLRLRNAGGGYRWFCTRAVPIRGAGGAITKWYGTSSEIEEPRPADAQHPE